MTDRADPQGRATRANEAPAAIQWAFLPLLGFSVYVASVTSGWTTALAVISALLVANAWVGLLVDARYYPPVLVYADAAILAFLFLMLLRLHGERDPADNLFWAYSAGLMAAYFVWDLIQREQIDQHAARGRDGEDYEAGRRPPPELYTVFLGLCVPVHVVLWVTDEIGRSAAEATAIGGGTWVLLIAGWHGSRWRSIVRSRSA